MSYFKFSKVGNFFNFIYLLPIFLICIYVLISTITIYFERQIINFSSFFKKNLQNLIYEFLSI